MSEAYSISVGKYSKYFLIHQIFDSKLIFCCSHAKSLFIYIVIFYELFINVAT